MFSPNFQNIYADFIKKLCVTEKKCISCIRYQALYTMIREKIHIEYPLNATSKGILWSAISTPMGLEGWFADKIISKDNVLTFSWGKHESRSAAVIAQRTFSFIRFRWLDDPNEDEYFELRMNYSELTNDYVLEITDFTTASEVDDLQELWDSQVDTLRRTCGF